MDFMERFADPQLIHGLTPVEKLAGSGMTALMGMGVTFIVLFLLWGCIAVLNRVMTYRKKTEEDAAEEAGAVMAQAPVSVIAAAVAAYSGSDAALVIRKIRRTQDQPLWARSLQERKVVK